MNRRAVFLPGKLHVFLYSEEINSILKTADLNQKKNRKASMVDTITEDPAVKNRVVQDPISEEKQKLCVKTAKELEISGEAMITYGVWSVIEAILVLFFGSQSFEKEMNDIFPETVTASERMTVMVITLVIVFLIIAGVFGFHYYIGRQAVREARNQKDGKLYLVGSGIMFLFCAVSFFMTLMHKDPELDLLDKSSTLLFSAAIVFISLDIIYSALRLKRFRKEMKGGNADEQ